MFGIWAGQLGQPADAFWTHTPRQVSAVMAGYDRRLLREHNERAWLAWHIAALDRIPRDKRLPKLDTMLAKPQQAPRRQTWQEQLAIMQDWSPRVNRAAAKNKGE